MVITGLGIYSSIGNSYKECLLSLKQGKSGIKFCEEYAQLNLPSQVRGELKDPIRAREFLGKNKIKASLGTFYATEALLDCLDSAFLDRSSDFVKEAGINIGTGGGAPLDVVKTDKVLQKKGVKKISTGSNFKVLPNNPNIVLGTILGMRGGSYGITSACATASNCIGDAFLRVKMGYNKIVFAGGCDENNGLIAATFCALRALSTHFNDTPNMASRPYDAKRDGFVMAGGAGVIVVEELEQALKRGAPIYAEILGYGFSSDGFSFTAPSGEGAQRCMKMALKSANLSTDKIDYINTHGTSTPKGDLTEIKAIQELFLRKEREYSLKISSTKALSGHGLGAAGAQEIIFSLIMMRENFLAPSNVESFDVEIKKMNLEKIFPQETEDYVFDTFLSNSFGFGGSNASLVVRKFF